MNDLRRLFVLAAHGMEPTADVEARATRVLVCAAVECAELLDEVVLEDVIALLRWAKHDGAAARDRAAACGIVRESVDRVAVEPGDASGVL